MAVRLPLEDPVLWHRSHTFLGQNRHSERTRRIGDPTGARVVGHLGRFVEPKNHAFLVDVVAESIALDPNVFCLMIGDGPLRPQIEQLVARRRLSKNFLFTGSVPDVQNLMLSAMDIFAFPSLSEGLPLTILEAQAAGLPSVISEHVTREAVVLPSQVESLQLADGPKQWAQAITRRLNSEPFSREEALAAVCDSPFTMGRSTQMLQDLYLELANPITSSSERCNLESIGS